jgi:hypothetical protein
MHNPFYLMVWVAGVCCLWLLWDWAIKSLFLDFFRERVFELRFCLFRMGMDGEVPFDSDVYRQLEVLLCGLLRFSHRISFLTFIFSKMEQKHLIKTEDHVDVAKEISLKIKQLNPDTQEKLVEMLDSVRNAILLYMIFTSLSILSISIVLFLARHIGVWRSEEAKKISGVIEQEAYRAESKRNLTLSPA